MEDERHPVLRLIRPIQGMNSELLNTADGIDALPDPDCSICMTEFENPCVVITTACNHTYHYSCLIQALSVSKGDRNPDYNCPLCRARCLPEIINLTGWVGHLIEVNRAMGTNPDRVMTRAQ